MAERRDYWTRSRAFSQVVAWLKQQEKKGHKEVLPPTIDPVVAHRILTRLALRGLAKHEGGTWTATPSLIHPTVIKESES